MGDAAWIDKRPADVVRTYYVKSLALVSEPRHVEAWGTFFRFLATFSGAEGLETTAESVVVWACSARQLHCGTWQNSCQFLTAKQTSFGCRVCWRRRHRATLFPRLFWTRCARNSKVQTLLARGMKLPTLQRRMCQRSGQNNISDHAMLRRQMLGVCKTLTRHQLTTASIEDLITQLREVAKKPISQLIRAASPEALYIAEAALRFCKSGNFEDKEQYYFTVRTRAHDFREQARNIPTQLSHVGLLPVQTLLSIVEEQYAQLVITSAAQLTIRLAVDSYFKGKKSEVKL